MTTESKMTSRDNSIRHSSHFFHPNASSFLALSMRVVGKREYEFVRLSIHIHTWCPCNLHYLELAHGGKRGEYIVISFHDRCPVDSPSSTITLLAKGTQRHRQQQHVSSGPLSALLCFPCEVRSMIIATLGTSTPTRCAWRVCFHVWVGYRRGRIEICNVYLAARLLG